MSEGIELGCPVGTADTRILGCSEGPNDGVREGTSVSLLAAPPLAQSSKRSTTEAFVVEAFNRLMVRNF